MEALVLDCCAVGPRDETHSDLVLAAAIADRDAAALRLVMRRNDQRLLRTAWQILRNRDDAEDAVQSAYLNAFAGIKGFAGKSTLSTWLTRIVTNAALAQARGLRRRRAWLEENPTSLREDYSENLMRGSMSGSPERTLARRQIKQLIDDAIDQLPVQFRTVFVMRQIEELDVGEVAETLGLNAATVRTRHLRARSRLQRALAPKLGTALADIFPFGGEAGERPAGRSRRAAAHGDWLDAQGRTA